MKTTNLIRGGILSLALIGSTLHPANAQTSFPCDGTIYLSNGTTLYTYASDGTPSTLFEIGNVNALAFSTTGLMWAFNQTLNTVVVIGSDGVITPITIPHLPTSPDYNVGAIDQDGYYYLYDGQQAARFYVIDTDPSRSTYGQLVDPASNGGVPPYALANPSNPGVVIQPAANRRIFSDWAFNPNDGMLYAVTNQNSVAPYTVVKYDPHNGNMTTVAGPITGDGFQGNVSIGAIFIDKHGNFWAFGNTQGHLYSVDFGTKKATRISTNSITNTSNIDGATCVDTDNPLPMRLGEFKAYLSEGNATLQWTTVQEMENAGFEIQRSADGKSWSNIGFVATKAENGNSTTSINYSFMDTRPEMGTNMYRLKQMDKDGTATYSAIKILKLQAEKNSITITPNPVRDYLSIQNTGAGSTIHIFDLAGRHMLSIKGNGENIDINLSGFTSGLYFVQIIEADGNIENHRIVKQ